MLYFLRWFTLSICLVLLTGCSQKDDNEDVPDNQSARRTVLIYVSAQNSLGYKDFQDLDSIEISNGHHLINDNDRLLVYMDDESNPRIYRYTRKKETPKLVRTWNEDINSSSPETLQDVLNWTKTHYPAQEYGLVMWSHSDGWLPSTNTNYRHRNAQTFSFGIDVNKDGDMMYDTNQNGEIGAQMDITDMAAAIKKSGIHLKYIFFDSCLMQNLEVAYALRDATDYIIGAPVQIPGCGANYTHLLQKGLFTDAEYDIVDTYATDAIKGYSDEKDEYYDYGIVLSSIRTDKLDALAKVTTEVLQNSLLTGRANIDLISKGVLNYNCYTSMYFFRPDNFDAQQAMQKILTEQDYVKFKQALDETIVTKGASSKFWIGPSNYATQTVDLNNYCGISAFVPQLKYSYKASYCIYGDLNKRFQETEWYKAAGWAATGW